MRILVDGNNVLPALGLLRPPQAEQFLQQLERTAAERDWDVTVVFDGPERFLRREEGILTVFYGKGRSADALIERMVHEAPDRSQVVVVTQDRSEADLVLGLGSRVWSPSRLKEEMG